ncbi:hypothetical protein [Flaviaesturariibacter amylovorans]|uniref:DUF4339 domain-containing protein n=1 Tax=Flaviaesturariibacter amylovorans TaxID=1084520 RepID=A0ABP8GWT8_9BACT
MKNYLLLRNNEESGPYSLAELKALPLRRLDLVWIEGESTRWYYASERPELRPFIHLEAYAPRPVSRRPQAAQFPNSTISLPQRATPSYVDLLTPEPTAPLPLPELKERAAASEPATIFRSRTNQRRSGLWILGLFLMLAAGAAVLHKVVDNESSLPVRPQTLAATPLPVLSEEESAGRPADISYQNALSREMRRPDSPVVDPGQLPVEELRRKVEITSVHEGDSPIATSELQVKVLNSSAYALDKVNFEVAFVKRDGKTVRSETYSVYSIAPGQRKILVLPHAKGSLKLRYKLLSVESNVVQTGQTPA